MNVDVCILQIASVPKSPEGLQYVNKPTPYLKYHLFTPPTKSPNMLECAGKSTPKPQCVCNPINKGGGGECGSP